MRHGEFSVWQFFPDGSYERVCQYVGPNEAVKVWIQCATSVGAKIGTTVRVIVTDGGDTINMEWKHGEGQTFPAKGEPGHLWDRLEAAIAEGT